MIVCNLYWRQNNQWIKLVFDEALGNHRLTVFTLVCGKIIEWNSDIWFASLDLTKTFARVAHDRQFQALTEQHVPKPYINLLKAKTFACGS